MNKTIIFDEKSCQWSKNELVNAWTLGAYECRLNDHLQTRGYLLLRDVYEALGIPITKESLIAGWVRAKIHEQFRFEIYTKTNGVMEAVLPDMELTYDMHYHRKKSPNKGSFFFAIFTAPIMRNDSF